jgi:hypothetical protein
MYSLMFLLAVPAAGDVVPAPVPPPPASTPAAVVSTPIHGEVIYEEPEDHSFWGRLRGWFHHHKHEAYVTESCGCGGSAVPFKSNSPVIYPVPGGATPPAVAPAARPLPSPEPIAPPKEKTNDKDTPF